MGRNAVILIMAGICLLSGCTNETVNKYAPPDATVLYEAYSESQYFVLYQQGDEIVKMNCNTGEQFVLKTTKAHYTEVLQIPKNVTKCSSIEDPIDLRSTYNDAQIIAPNTYQLAFSKSTNYLSTLLNSGYISISFKRSPNYIDYYITKDSAVFRIIITRQTIKILKIDKENIISPETYINERGSLI